MASLLDFLMGKKALKKAEQQGGMSPKSVPPKQTSGMGMTQADIAKMAQEAADKQLKGKAKLSPLKSRLATKSK